ncbi:MAG: ATP-binding cassette domain-containing protein [Pseudomonadota bacterium]|nr:ATP-binding cassette domain-containing protein [Pseudomonadota bacterium]
MPAFLSLHDLSLKTPDGRTLVDDLTLAFGSERTGIVGANGSGKSTLLAAMAAGGPGLSQHGTLGLFDQRLDQSQPVPAALGVDRPLAQLDRIESGDFAPTDLDTADWTLPTRIESVLARLDLPDDTLSRHVGDLSGGQRTRLSVARAMLDAPDLLLMDEPTNNLDRAGRAVIAEMIAGWSGGVVVVSHDRALLGGMDRILELSPTGWHLHGGGWSVYAEARAAREARAKAALETAERDLARTKREVRAREEKKARRDRAGRALRASGGQPKILLDAKKDRAGRTAGREAALSQKLEAQASAARETASALVAAKRDLRIDAAAGAAHGVVLSVNGVEATRGDFQLGPIDLTIRAGEHVALEGENGAGKSTLLDILRGRLAATGDIRMPGRIAMLDQQADTLKDDETIVAGLRRLHPTMSPNDAHAILARFAFRNTDAEKLVGTLSGGERLRAGLAAALGGPAPDLLILDEPTNHLDIEAVEVLEAALADYPGALLVVSHDTAFLDAIGIDRVCRLAEGKLTE